MNSPIEEIKKAVAENRTSDALSRLLELSQSDKQVHDIIVIISGEFRDLNLQQLKGIIDNKEATQRLNAVHNRILNSLNLFDSAGRVLPGSVVGRKSSATAILGRLTFIFIGVGGVLYFIVPQNHRIGNIPFFVLGAGAWIFFFYLVAVVASAFKK